MTIVCPKYTHEVMDLLTTTGRPMKLGTIATRTNISEYDTAKVLSYLCRSGWAVRLAGGKELKYKRKESNGS